MRPIPDRLLTFLSSVSAAIDQPIDQRTVERIAKALVSALRPADSTVRWGIYLPDTDDYRLYAESPSRGHDPLPRSYSDVPESWPSATVGAATSPKGYLVAAAPASRHLTLLAESASAGLRALMDSAPLALHSHAQVTAPPNPQHVEHSEVQGQELFAGRVSGPTLSIELDHPEVDQSRDNTGGRGNDRGDASTATTEGATQTQLEAFDTALAEAQAEISRYIEDPAGIYRDVAEPVFRPQLLMLEDESFSGSMRERIRHGRPAPAAIAEVALELEEQLKAIEVPRIREKADDVRDLKLRLLAHLPGGDAASLSARGHIAIVHEPLPSTLIRLALDGAAGLVLVGRNLTAHVTILAGSLGIPAVLVPPKSVVEVPDGQQAEITGGTVRFGAPAVTKDAPPIRPRAQELSRPIVPNSLELSTSVLANVNLLRDAYAAADRADGVGLYRSEFPFIIHQGFPSEEVQYRIYKDIADCFPSKPVTFRTADIGGDKLIGAEHEGEANPFLGVRGIRYSLANREMFRSQLRAMLRAGAGRDLRIMFPMVSTPDEVEQAKGEVQAAIYELVHEGLPVNRSPKIGAMIEIPSAVIAVDELAAELDFLSIGTNDLIMYMLAVDRTNSRVAGLYRTHHPIILRALSYITEHAGDNASVSVCGSAAADPTMIPFFLGIGIRELSVSPQKIERVRSHVRSRTAEDCNELAEEMLSIRSWSEMERYLSYTRRAADRGA